MHRYAYLRQNFVDEVIKSWSDDEHRCSIRYYSLVQNSCHFVPVSMIVRCVRSVGVIAFVMVRYTEIC